MQSFVSSTFSGCVKVPALQGVLGSHSLTDLSQLPVTMTLTSGQYSTQRMGASCVPTIVSTQRRKYGTVKKNTVHLTLTGSTQFSGDIIDRHTLICIQVVGFQLRVQASAPSMCRVLQQKRYLTQTYSLTRGGPHHFDLHFTLFVEMYFNNIVKVDNSAFKKWSN